MIRERNGLTYLKQEQEFVKYFDRLRDTGMTFEEVETVLPQLESYYYEMVVVPEYRKPEPTIRKTFENWKYSIQHPF